MISRRTLLASTLPVVALSACATATRRIGGAPGIIHGYAAPRPAKDLDHAVVYRRENEFCAWTYTRGFWENAKGELMQNFDAITIDYRDPDFINHNNVFSKHDSVQVNGGKRHIARSIFSV